MKLLVVDHNALDPVHRGLYNRICEFGGIELRLVVPSRWFNNYNMLHFERPIPTPGYDICESAVLFPTRTHRMVYISLAKHVRDFKPDLLYMNAEPENFQTFQAAMLAQWTGTKLVFSSWRNIDHREVGYPYKLAWLHVAIEKFVLRRSCSGIVFTKAAKEIFAKHGFTRTTVIPPPLPAVLAQETKRNVPSVSFTIGFVGRLVPEKGVDLILQALAKLPPLFRALIVGNGDFRAGLEKMADDLGLARRVEFRDAVASESVGEVFSQIDVLVLPSRTTKYWREQFGRVLVEAMACGVPVVGSDSGEIPSVIADAGLVFHEGDADALRECLERLHTDPALASRCRQDGLSRVRQVYLLEIIAKQYHSVFTSL